MAVFQTRRSKLWLAFGVVLVLAGGLAVLGWWHFRPKPIPELPLGDVEQELAEVIVATRTALEQDPRSASAWGNFGRALQVNEVFIDVSRTCFEEAQRLDPQDPRWPYFLANVDLSEGKRDQAIKNLQRSIELCGNQSEDSEGPRLLLGETLASLGQQEDAEEQFRQVLAANPQNPRANFALGTLRLSSGDRPAARAHLQRCLSNPQTRKRASAQLATLFEETGDQTNAEYYAKLESNFPKDAPPSDKFLSEHAHLARRKRHRYRIVEQMEAQGQLAAAEAILKQLVEVYPQEDTPHLLFARVVAQRGKYDLAEEHLRIALKLAPEKYQAHYLLALALLRRGEVLLEGKQPDKQKATALFEESARLSSHVLSTKPDYGFAHMSYGLALKRLGKDAEAFEEFAEAVHCNPEFADNHLNYGIALAERGRSAEARYHLEQAQQLAGPSDSRPATALKQHLGAPK